jgi:hypothetical protein
MTLGLDGDALDRGRYGESGTVLRWMGATLDGRIPRHRF